MNSNPLLLVSIIIIISSCFNGECEGRNKHKKCIHQCGSIEIPYPFGIGPAAEHCYYDPNFAVSCKSSSSNQSIPCLNKLGFEILEIKMEFFTTVTVKIPKVTTCSGTTTSPDLTNSSFSYLLDEDRGNVLASVGCDGYALLLNDKGVVIAGCSSVCALNPPPPVITRSISRCNGYRCCQAHFYEGDSIDFKNYSIIVSESTNNISGNYCRSAFFISSKYVGAAEQLSLSRIAAIPVVLLFKDNFIPDYYSKDGFKDIYFIIKFNLGENSPTIFLFKSSISYEMKFFRL